MRFALALAMAALACAPVGSRERPESAPALLARFERTTTPEVLAAGERRLVAIDLTNLGSRSWVSGARDGVRVSYHWRGPKDVWDGERTPLPGEVRPGSSVELIATLVAPTAPGEYALVWDLVDEGVAWFGADGGAFEQHVEVQAPEARAEWTNVKINGPLHADVVTLADVTLRNTGSVLWTATGEGAVLLSYHWRNTAGQVVRWDGERTKLDRPVPPGESTAAKMRIAPPNSPGRYVLELDLVRDGIAWFGSTSSRTVDVGPASYSYSMEFVRSPKRVVIGQPIDVRVRVTNTGGSPWPTAGNRRLRFSYHIVTADGRVALWDGARTEIGRSVDAGDSVEVQATVRAPDDAGTYTFWFDLVQEGAAWLSERNRALDLRLEVVPLDFAASLSGLQAVNRMAIEMKYKASVRVQNVGTVVWPRGGFAPVRLAYHWLDANGKAVVWDGPRTDLPKDVEPNEAVTLNFDVSPPREPGTYTLVVDLVQEGVAWFSDKRTQAPRLQVVVARPSFQASWRDVEIPKGLRAGAIAKAKVSIRNDGLFPWTATGDHPVVVAHHWQDSENRLVAWDGFRTAFDRDVEPGETVKVEVWFFAPATPGEYTLEIDLVQEGVTWFGWRGNPVLRRTVEVAP